MKKKLAVFLSIILMMSALFATTALAAPYGSYKDIKAWFGNISVLYNGQILTLESPPFLYNNVAYVPIRVISDLTGKNISWDQNNYAIVITDGTSPLSSYAAPFQGGYAGSAQVEIDARDARIAELESRLYDLENGTYNSQSNDRDRNSISDFEDYLEEEYSNWNRMDFDFDARGTSDDIELVIQIDMSDDGIRWRDTDEYDIDEWLDDIYDYVQDEYPRADFSGEVIDTDSNNRLVAFRATSNGKLNITFNKNNNPDDLEYELYRNLSTRLSNYGTGFGSMRVDYNVTANESRKRIYLTVTIPSAYNLNWKSIYDTDGADEWINDIIDMTYTIYENDYELIGEIVDSNENTLVTFDENGADW